jgi:hypothetical protein
MAKTAYKVILISACIAKSQTKGRSGMNINVAIPVCNAARFLPHCVGSIFAQTLKPDEIILVVNRSPLTESLQSRMIPARGRHNVH